MTLLRIFDVRNVLIALTAAIVALAGCSSGVLTIESGDTPPEQFAADELRKYIGLLSETTPDLTFRIGTRYLELFPDDRSFLQNGDGYAVRTREGVIYIVSPQPRGCLYGVYDFLERNSDLIWARPDLECGTIYTRTRMFRVCAGDFRESPVFQVRGWWFCGASEHEPSELWHARMRCNFGCSDQKIPEVRARAIATGSLTVGDSGHNLASFMPESLYDGHPEYFAEVDGIRRRDAEKTQLCFSNLQGADAVGSNAVREIAVRCNEWIARVGNSFDGWALKQEDNMRLCECSSCCAEMALDGGRISKPSDENFRSNQTFLYLNRAMEVIERAYPSMRVNTFGYQFTAPPPDVKIHEKLDVAFCPFVKNDRFAVTNEVNRKWRDRANRWAQATTNVIWREYWGCAARYPRPNSLVAVDDLRWINSALGFTRVYSETSVDGDFTHLPRVKGRAKKDRRLVWDASALEHWVLSRLMWNPYVAVERYRDEYIRRTYRNAAPVMREFYSIIAATWFSDGAMSCYRDDPHGNAARYLVRTKVSKRLLGLLDEAIRLTEGDVPAVRQLLMRQKNCIADLISNAGEVKEPVSVPCIREGGNGSPRVFDGFCLASKRRALRNPDKPVARGTRVRFWHDLVNLHVVFSCDEPHVDRLVAESGNDVAGERFPAGDHVEFALTANRAQHVYHFAVDCRNGRSDSRDGDIGFDAKWVSSVRMTESGYEVALSIDLESLGVELTKFNLCGVAFARMSTTERKKGKPTFSAWKGVHPLCTADFEEVVLSCE